MSGRMPVREVDRIACLSHMLVLTLDDKQDGLKLIRSQLPQIGSAHKIQRRILEAMHKAQVEANNFIARMKLQPK